MQGPRLAEDKDGNIVFKNPSTGNWEPLIDGQSSFTPEDGIQRVWSQRENSFVPVEDTSDILLKGMAQANTAIPALADMLGVPGADTVLARAREDARLAAQQFGATRPEDIAAAQQVAAAEQQGYLPTAQAYLTNPGYLARQVGGSLPTMGLAAAGAFAAGPGAIAAGVGGMASGTAVEAGSSYLNNLEQMAAQQGVNLSDPNALAQFKNTVVNPMTGQTAGQAASQMAGQRAIAMAPFLGIAAGRAAGVGANLGIRPVLQGIGEQAALEAAGEATGQVAERGEVYSRAAIVEGAIAEGVFGVPEFFGHYIKNRVAQGVSPDKAKVEADEIEKAADQELATNEAAYLEAAKTFNAQRGTAIDNKKLARSLARKAVATGNGFTTKRPLSTQPTGDDVKTTLQPELLTRLQKIREDLTTAGADEKTIQNVLAQEFQKNQQVAIVPGEGVRGTQGLTEADIAQAQQRAKEDAAKAKRRAKEDAFAVKQQNKLNKDNGTELQAPEGVAGLLESPESLIMRRAEEKRVQESRVRSGNEATMAAMTVLERNRKIGRDARAMAEARARSAFEEMKNVKGFNEKKEDYVKRYAANLLPDIAEELRTNPDYIAGKATPERNEKGRFTGKLTAPGAEPGSLLTTQRNEAQRQLEQTIAANPSTLLSQEEATAALPPQMQQATVDMGIEAFSQQQAAARAQRQADALATTQAAQRAVLPDTSTNPRTGNKRVKPKGNKRKYSKFGQPQGNVIDITERLARKRNLAEAQEQLKLNQEKMQKIAREGDVILRKLLAKLNLLGKVNPILALEKLKDNAGGYVEGKTLVISALQPEGREFMDTFNHEVIHILRNLGLFTPQEWNTLTKAAVENGWVEKYLGDTEAYNDLTPEELLEEAIAEHFAQTAKIKAAVNTPTTGLIDRLGKRITDFFKTLRMFVESALGITTPEEVLEIFDAIENGVIGLRNNDLANPESNPIKYSKDLVSRIKGQKDYILSPETQNKLLRRSPGLWPVIGEFFTDITSLAGRIREVRPYRDGLAEQRKIDHTIRQMGADVVEGVFKDVPPKEVKVITKAATALRLNDEAPRWPADGKGMIITLKNKDAYLGPAGTKFTLSAAQVEKLKQIQTLMQATGNRWVNAVAIASMGHLKDKTNTSLSELLKGKEDPVQFLSDLVNAGRISTQQAQEARAILDTLKAERDTVNNRFYIPFVRTSPWFLDFVNQAGEKVTVALPTSLWGDGLAKGDSFLKFVDSRLRELKARDATYEVSGEPRKVDAVKDWSITERELSAFERLAMLAAAANTDQVNNSKELASKIFASLRRDMEAKGFKQNWVKSQNIPGYLHDDNVENYLPSALLIYTDRAAKGISIAETSGRINKALTDIAEATKNNRLNPSVLKAVTEHYDYLTNPELQEASWSNKLRAITFHMFLGFNPASAFLNLFQTLHTTLPVLVAMSGSSGMAMKEIAVASRYAHKFLRGDLQSWKEANIFKPINEVQDVPEDIKRVVNDLIRSGAIKVIITEEMQAKSSVRGVVGGQTSREAAVRKWIDGYSNISASLFSRTEGMNRIISAIAAYNLAKKAQTNPKMMAKLQKYLDTTAFSSVNVDDPTAVAEAMVELSQFDTTMFNRAKAFRGSFMALPTQFMAFPVRMVQLYADLLRNALGSFNPDGSFAGFKDAQTKQAFVVMLMGLLATSGMMGAVPMAGAGADLYDLIYNQITGVDPDIERKLREVMVDITGSPVLGEIAMKGFMNQLLNADVGDRVGAALFSGIQTDFTLFDLAGPLGGLVEQTMQAGTRMNQGHEVLAVAQLLPPLFRNIGKAYYEGEYGIVSGQGNLLPTDYTLLDRVVQSLGFTPIKVRETRDIEYAKERLSATPSIARERFTDQMVTARVKMALASREGKDASQFAEQFRRLRQELVEYNRKAAPEEKINIERTMKNVQRRVKEQLAVATQNRTSERRIPSDKRGIIKDITQSTYPGGYSNE